MLMSPTIKAHKPFASFVFDLSLHISVYPATVVISNNKRGSTRWPLSDHLVTFVPCILDRLRPIDAFLFP